MVRFGESIANRIPAGSVIFLHGDLGAGKTTLVRGLISGLGCTVPVTSPTYTIVESYVFNEFIIYHFDLYRLSEPDELESIGVRDMIGGEAISIFEWPERGRGVLPIADFDIIINFSDDGRTIEVPEPLFDEDFLDRERGVCLET